MYTTLLLVNIGLNPLGSKRQEESELICKHVVFDGTISKPSNVDKPVEPVFDAHMHDDCKYESKYSKPNSVKEENKQRMEEHASSVPLNKTSLLITNQMTTNKEQIDDEHKSSCSDGSFELGTHHQVRQDAMFGIITVHTVDI